jgi:hypothetical protein
MAEGRTVIDWANAKREEELRQPMRDDARTPDEASAFQQQYTAAKMEDTVWEDLKVRIGVPYLFCHQGNCEHRVIINDIRCAALLVCCCCAVLLWAHHPIGGVDDSSGSRRRKTRGTRTRIRFRPSRARFVARNAPSATSIPHRTSCSHSRRVVLLTANNQQQQQPTTIDRYLTYNDELSPQNPCFFCEKCYAPFHYAYDSRGTLLLNHDVFKYHHE